MKRTLLILWLLLSLLLGSFPVSAEAEAASSPAEEIVNGIIRYQLQTNGVDTLPQWLECIATKNAGVSAEWYVLAFSQNGTYDCSAYEEALLDYAETHTVNAVGRQKYALCLAAIGSTDSYIREVMQNSIGKQGIMSRIFGLHLLNNGYSADTVSADTVIRALLDAQGEDGGWALQPKAAGDVDISAMALQALAPHRTNPAVTEAITRGLTFLSQRQTGEGDFLSYGVCNPESTAQVILALTALGIDSETDARFIKGGNRLFDVLTRYRLSDGSFCHTLGGTANDNATAQVLQAAVAYLRFQQGQPSFYLLDHAAPDRLEALPDMPVTEQTDASSPPTTPSITTDCTEEITVTAAPTDAAPSLRWTLCTVTVAIGLLAVLILSLCGKAHRKNLLAVLGFTVAVAVFFGISDIRTPDEYYGETVDKDNPIGTVTLAIRCDTVIGLSDAPHIPADGVLLPTTEFVIEEGDTVCDLLMEAAQAYRIPVENNGTAAMAYIVGIGHLYEFDFGDLSGWIYRVNGTDTSVGCSDYRLADGDTVVWHYTLRYGHDIE